jgi:serine/threonine protein kinase
MSPEILEQDDASPTFASDIWAFGMTTLQVGSTVIDDLQVTNGYLKVYTGKVPFEKLRNDAKVIASLTRGNLPDH